MIAINMDHDASSYVITHSWANGEVIDQRGAGNWYSAASLQLRRLAVCEVGQSVSVHKWARVDGEHPTWRELSRFGRKA